MKKGFFVTGTNTDVGKTYIANEILKYWNKKNLSTLALKPVASGSDRTPEGLRNSDALTLQKTASIDLPYHHVNPFTFEPPIAPHIAAAQMGNALSVQQLLSACEATLQHSADRIIIEGVGGWCVPLNDTEYLSDFAKALDFPVILVVGMTLGCLNHSLLTWEQLKQSQVNVAGWIANCIDPQMKCLDENIDTLSQHISAPRLAIVEYGGAIDLDL